MKVILSIWFSSNWNDIISRKSFRYTTYPSVRGSWGDITESPFTAVWWVIDRSAALCNFEAYPSCFSTTDGCIELVATTIVLIVDNSTLWEALSIWAIQAAISEGQGICWYTYDRGNSEEETDGFFHKKMGKKKVKEFSRQMYIILYFIKSSIFYI